MSWKSVIGQNKIKELLKATLENKKLPHAYIFLGEEGRGRYPLALELAKAVNCERSSSEACDLCNSCVKIMNLQHPNLFLVFPLPVGKNEDAHDSPYAKLTDEQIDAIQEQLKLKSKNPYHKIRIEKANEIKVNSIREIRRQAAISSFMPGKKVFIIINAEMMNEESSNAFLKTLEEPVSDTLFIIITEKLESLLPTIVSRCQVLRFEPLGENDIQEALVEKYQINKETAKSVAGFAGGSFSRALEYIDPDIRKKNETAINFLRTILTKSRTDISKLIEELTSTYSRQDFIAIFLFLQQWFRNAMLLKEGLSTKLSGEESNSLEKFIKSYPLWDYPTAIEAVDHSISHLNKNVYIPLVLINLIHGLKSAIGERKLS